MACLAVLVFYSRRTEFCLTCNARYTKVTSTATPPIISAIAPNASQFMFVFPRCLKAHKNTLNLSNCDSTVIHRLIPNPRDTTAVEERSHCQPSPADGPCYLKAALRIWAAITSFSPGSAKARRWPLTACDAQGFWRSDTTPNAAGVESLSVQVDCPCH